MEVKGVMNVEPVFFAAEEFGGKLLLNGVFGDGAVGRRIVEGPMGFELHDSELAGG